ncbi:MAG: hypothetical protein ACXVAY_02815 [Mucilaginibacter sp.]
MLFLLYVAGFFLLLGFANFIDAGGFNLKKRHLLKHGTLTIAKVNSIEKTIVELGEGVRARPVMRLVLDIKISGATYKQVTIKHAFFRTPQPKVGDNINILIDPDNSDNIMIAPNQNIVE